MVRVVPTLAAAALIASAGTAAADIYECRGPDGATHYTNRPQKGRHCKRVVDSGSKDEAKSKRARARRRSSPTVDSTGPKRFAAYIRNAAQLYQLPVSFLRAVMKVESAFQPQAVSHAGAMGLMQLMPQTAVAMGVHDPFDPRQNIFGGARYLRVLANRFDGDLVLTIAAYNAGEKAVMRHEGVPPYDETQRYVRRVMRYYYAYREDATGARARGNEATASM